MDYNEYSRLIEDATRFKNYVNVAVHEALNVIHAQQDPTQQSEWAVKGFGELAWKIHLKGDEQVNYMLMVSPDLKMIIVTHGNKDIGPLTLSQVLEEATYISASALYRFSLAEMLVAIMSLKGPNHYGYT
jgi:hypothetical protein